jgi:hypothetical protein
MSAGDRSQIHHSGRAHDVELHKVDECRPAGQIFDGGPALHQREPRKR